MKDSARQWLCAALSHRSLPDWPAEDDGLIAAAEDEGVLLLLEYRLQTHPQAGTLPAPWLSSLHAAAREQALMQMAMLAEQRKVFDALRAADSNFLVMKGGALAHWLYTQPLLRQVTDLDILLPDQQAVENLAPVLSEIGYSLGIANPVANERAYQKPGGPYENFSVDAHWRLFNRALLKDSFSFDELNAEAKALPGCDGIKGLSPVHALFNAIGHRALALPHRHLQGIQRANGLRWLWDIHGLATSFDTAQWQRVVELAWQKQWSALIQEALLRVQEEFGTLIPEPVLQTLALQAAKEPMQMSWFASLPRYQWQEFLASDSSWRGRWHWLGQRLWPDPEWVQARYGENEPLWKTWPRRLAAGIRRMIG